MKKLRSKWAILGLLVLLSPLAIGSFWFSSITYPALWIYVPIVVYKILPKSKSRLKTVLIIIAAAFYICFSLLPLLRFLLCGYGQKQEEYISKENATLKIVGRDFSCFGTTGDLVLYKQYSVTKYLNIEFHYKTFFDYKNVPVDTTQWKRIENSGD